MTSRRYTKKEEILADIDKCHQEAQKMIEMADGIEKGPLAYGSEDEIKRLRTRAGGLLKVKAVKLKEKLAEFQTEVFPFMEGDHSIDARITDRDPRAPMPGRFT